MKIKMLLSGWSKNLSIYSNVYNPINNDEIINIFLKSKISNFIPRGLGRSYGDSSLADNVISLKNYKKFYNFDGDEGIIECSSNHSLDELIKIILKKIPGTKYHLLKSTKGDQDFIVADNTLLKSKLKIKKFLNLEKGLELFISSL